jgi:hypothetical protein
VQRRLLHFVAEISAFEKIADQVQRVLLKLGSEQERPCLRAVEGAQLVRIRLTEIKEMLYTAQRVGLRLYIK